MAGPIRFDGLVSGLDFTSIIEKLVSLQKRPITFLQDQIKTDTARKAGLLGISAKLLSLKGAIGLLGKTTFFDRTVVSSSNETVLTASGVNVQSTGSFPFTVRRLAQAHQVLSGGFASKTAALGGGELSIELGNGFVDRRTSVDFLNAQAGIDRGSLRMRTATQSVTIDLTDAITMQDVLDRINNNGVLSVTARINNDAIDIENGTGALLTVEDLDADTTATSLGIAAANVAIGGTLRGSRINTIAGTTELRLLNDGLGIRTASGNDFRITPSGGLPIDFDVDLDANDTRVQDVLDAINGATGNNGRVVARVNAEGNAIELQDNTGGAGNLAVAALGSSNAAVDLGFMDEAGGVLAQVASEVHAGAPGANYLLGKRLIPTLNSVLKRTLNGGVSQFRPISGQDPTGVTNGVVSIQGRNGATASVNVSTRLATTITTPVVNPNDTQFDVASTAGLAIGNEIRLLNAGGFQETRTITAIAGTQITVDRGLTFGYVAGNSTFSNNQSLADVVNAIDTASGLNLAVSFNAAGNGLLIRDTTAAPTTALRITGAAAASLGIDTLTEELQAESGAAATIVDTNLVGYANGYFVGATVNVTSGTGSPSGPLTVTGFNGSTGTLTLSGGGPFDSTSVYSIDAVLGDRETGSDVDPQYIGDNTLLSTLNQGEGVFAGRFTVTDASGTGFTIDLRQEDDDTIGDVIEEINGAAGAAGSDLEARINDTGDGIVLIDPTGTVAIRVVDLDGGTTARDLNIDGAAPSATPGTLDGSFEYEVTVGATDTLDDVVKAINSLRLPVVASVLDTGSGVNPFRLSLLSRTSGSAGRLVVNSDVSGLAFSTSSNAQDAVLLYGSNGGAGDPAVIVSDSNTVTNVVPGLTLDLKSASSTPVTVTVGRDVEGVADQVTRFVDAYNAAIDLIKDLTSFDPEDPENKGVLFGDSTVSGIKRTLANNVTRAVDGIPVNELNTFAKIGIRLDSTGKLSFDQSKLTDALSTDYEDVERLFTLQRGLAPDVPVDDLNDGRGINDVTGDDFRITQRDGATITIDVSGLSTVSQILAAINNPSVFTRTPTVDAATTSNGESFELVDASIGYNGTAEASGVGTFTDNVAGVPPDDGLVGTFANDFWNGQQVLFTSGALAGQTFSVTDYDSATGTITFDSTLDPGASGYRLIHDFEVEQLNSSRAAADLGINLNVGTENRLTGRRINVSQDPGLGRRFDVGIGGLTDLPDGLIPTKTGGIDDEIEGMNDRIDRLNDRADSLRERLIRRFAALENFLAQSQGTQNQITGVLNNLVSTLKSNVTAR